VKNWREGAKVSRGFCVDASVGAKWFFGDENLAPQARQLAEGFLTGQYDVAVPELFFYELGNAFYAAARSGRVTPEWALEALATLQEMRLTTVAVNEHLESTFALSYRFAVSFYAAAYLSTAESCEYPLITADQRLHNAVHSDLPFVTLLGQAEF
jgi:predicted nucleic acid-binding protein